MLDGNFQVSSLGFAVPDSSLLTLYSVGQGAALWKPGYDLARLISDYWHTTEWEFFEEDPAMIWEIPEGRLLTSPAMSLAIRECITQTSSGTKIPKVLQLLQHESAHDVGDYVLQPAQPMLFESEFSFGHQPHKEQTDAYALTLTNSTEPDHSRFPEENRNPRI